MTQRLRGSLLLLLTLGLAGCDQATKWAARSFLSMGRPVTLIRDVLDLRYAENHDTAFSLTRSLDFAGKPVLLGILAVLAMAFACSWAWRMRRSMPPLGQAAFAVIVAGAVGNLADRFVRGSVTDFIHVHHWPIFNVADALVLVGAVVLMLTVRRPAEGAAA